MKTFFFALVLSLITAPVLAQEDDGGGSYSEGYNAGSQTPNLPVPSETSSDYYYGYVHAQDDANADNYRRQEQEQEPSTRAPSNDMGGSSEGDDSE